MNASTAALCAALDDGDDTVLPVLADALEEAQAPDEMIRAMRLTAPPKPLRGSSRWLWSRGLDNSDFWWHEQLPCAVFDRLRGGELMPADSGPPSRLYASNLDAYLDLVKALS